MASFVLVGCIAGCVATDELHAPEEPIQSRVVSFQYWQWTAPPLDVLIVVDNSASMAEHEERVTRNLVAISQRIEDSGWVDMRIGITTADVGCANRAAWRYDEQLTNGQYIIDWRHLDGTATQNFVGEVSDHVARLASAGHAGCGHHRPLDAIVAALDPQAGFRRDDADLMLVVIGATDDQSLGSIDLAVTAIGEAPHHTGPIVVAAVPDAANRLRTFAERVDDNALVSSIAADEFLDLRWSFGLKRSLVGPPCQLAERFDTSDEPGIQASCSMADRVRKEIANGSFEAGPVIYERVLPGCTGSNRPCWRFERTPSAITACTDREGPAYELVIDRIDFPPMHTNLVGQCEVVETP